MNKWLHIIMNRTLQFFQSRQGATLLIIASAILLLNLFTGIFWGGHFCGANSSACSPLTSFMESLQPSMPFSYGSGANLIEENIAVLDTMSPYHITGSGGILDEQAIVEKTMNKPEVQERLQPFIEKATILPIEYNHLKTYLFQHTEETTLSMITQKNKEITNSMLEVVQHKLPLDGDKQSVLNVVNTFTTLYASENSLFEITSFDTNETIIPKDLADVKQFTITLTTTYGTLEKMLSDISQNLRIAEYDPKLSELPLLDISSIKISSKEDNDITNVVEAQIAFDLYIRKIDDQTIKEVEAETNALQQSVETQIKDAGTLDIDLEDRITTILKLIDTERANSDTALSQQEYRESLHHLITIKELYNEILHLLQ